ncbi:hypothetical protein Tco_1008037 [Tanacetum coccineum]
MPHESPLHSVHSLGRDEGSLSLNELTDLCTSLSKKVGALENELQQTKKTYNTALTKLILRVKKLEQKVKTTKARRRARIVLSEDEEDVEDSFKHGRKISAIDKDPTISLVQPEQEMEHDGSREKGEKEVNTVGAELSTAAPTVSIVAENLVYIIRSAEKKKDKGKGIMTKPKPEKKTKKQLEQERLGRKEAINKAEQERVVAKDDQAHVIDWSDPAVLRYHAQLNRPYSIAEVRKNMVMYLKNQGIQDRNKEKGSKKKAGGSRKKTLARKRAGEKQSDQSAKRQKTEYEKEKEELKAYLDLVQEKNLLWKLNLWILNKGSKNYKIFSEMLDDFDRHDVMDLHRLVEERIHILLMDNGIAIHMMIEKKYPLTQEMLSKMLSRKLEVDHEKELVFEHLMFIRSQVQE